MKVIENQNLKSLPNVGDHLFGMLNNIGIHTPEQMAEAGTELIFLKIRQLDPEACLSMLCAIEGAISGVRWHQLPPQRKSELKSWLKSLG